MKETDQIFLLKFYTGNREGVSFVGELNPIPESSQKINS